MDRKAGGFFQSFARNWSLAPTQPKTLVFQARMTWVAASLARRREDATGAFRHWARHGVHFLEERFWDHLVGGFSWTEGDPDNKHSYGIAFALYAAAAAHRAEIPGALELARRGFAWLDRYAHDDQDGGYFEALARDGSPLGETGGSAARDRIGNPVGQKSANTHLHLLEAFCELHRAAPDAALRARIEELTALLGEAALRASGALPWSFTRDWQPVDRRVSYGHLVEAAYLLVGAGDILARPSLEAATRLTDEVLRHGFDRRHGGVFWQGTAGRLASRRAKVWWVQAEALNCLLLMHERLPLSAQGYLARFLESWAFVKRRQLDRRQSGWFERVSRSGRWVLDGRKAHAWKAAYHDVRALLDVEDRLWRLAGGQISGGPARLASTGARYCSARAGER